MLDWIDLLNDHAEWTSEDSLIAWFSEMQGKEAKPDQNAIAYIFGQLSFIRAQLCALHFDEPLDTKTLAQKLQTLQIDFGYLLSCKSNYGQAADDKQLRDDGQSHDDGMFRDDEQSHEAVPRGRPISQPLPLLHVKPKSKDDSGLLVAIGDTALLQFAWFLSDALFSGNKNTIARCEGIYRVPAPDGTDLCATKAFNNEQESRFRQELPVLADKDIIQDKEVQRCCDFFIAKPKARFCSDTCRYTTFQLTKQFEDPNYLAQKQRRYRSKQKNN